MQWWLLCELKDRIKQFFKKETIVADGIPLPYEFINRERDQLSSTQLLKLLISISRLKEEFYGAEIDHEILCERTLKEAGHEVGHLYGLQHCNDLRCVMHFSNSIVNTDKKSEKFRDMCRDTLRICCD